MKNIIVIFILSVFLLPGCLIQHKKEEKRFLTGALLKELSLKAINGDTKADSTLSGLCDLSLPLNNSFNSFLIDSIYSTHGHKYYYLLIGFPNPIYNRFAVYDSTFNLYLIDKSMNGYLNSNIINKQRQTFLSVLEDFRSEGTFELNRISYFMFKDTSVALVFRTFTRAITAKNIFTQSVEIITKDSIITIISSAKHSTIDSNGDVFLYNDKLGKYIGTNNVFSNFIENQINAFNHDPLKPEITDYNSALKSVGIDPVLDTLRSTSNLKNIDGYSITLPENWKTLRNIEITNFVKHNLKGSRYISEYLGATISIIKIPVSDSAETYINYNLNKETSGKYRVRYSDKIELKKDFVQFFEYSCGHKKYLLILQASKYTYLQDKDIYQSIINSFTINC